MSGILIYAVAILVGVLVLIGLGVFCARTFALRSTLEEWEKAWESERSLRQQGENFLQGERVRLRDELEQLRADYLKQNFLAQQIMESQRDELYVVNRHLEESLDDSLDESPSDLKARVREQEDEIKRLEAVVQRRSDNHREDMALLKKGIDDLRAVQKEEDS